MVIPAIIFGSYLLFGIYCIVSSHKPTPPKDLLINKEVEENFKEAINK